MIFGMTTFNLTCDYWVTGTAPATHPATTVDLPCQLYWTVRSSVDIQPSNVFLWFPPLMIKLRREDYDAALVDPKRGSIFRVIDPTAGPLFCYKARFWEFVHQGMPNEYLAVIVDQCDTTGLVPDPAR